MGDVFSTLGLNASNSGVVGKEWMKGDGGRLDSFSPIDGKLLGSVTTASAAEYDRVVREAHETFLEWRLVPAPERGQVVREIGNALRDRKAELGNLVTLEMGKILTEGLGEVQEAIDIADFAVGLSRQLYGKTMHSERPGHRMYEQWHPLGVCGVITAFNFPVAVWAWNAMIAAVCGDTVVWKPSELTPLSAIATLKICREVAERRGFPGLFGLVTSAGPEHGKAIAADRRFPLVSATGSCVMGRAVGQVVSERLGRSLLELGGNNAIIILKDADLGMAIRSVLFGAVGTAGQRCTSTRRVFVERAILPSFLEQLKRAYAQVRIGNPLDPSTLMGPLVHERAVRAYQAAITSATSQGGKLVYGGGLLEGKGSPLYVEPAIIEAKRGMAVMGEETFAPILYVVPIDSVEEGIAANNEVAQGLSSAIFTRDLKAAERFLAHAGSDCGIANVNIGTSGAEIGGAFGGEKDTGGGREAGSDCWQQYMRRQTTTINFSDKLPLAQGITFDVG
jgi:aldehyde dehydrogenase (NAD+)